MSVIIKETTDEIFVTLQSVLHLLHNQVYLFDYKDVVACAPVVLRNLKETTFLRWFNNPLWTIQNKTVHFDWGKKRTFMSAMRPTFPVAASVMGLDTALLNLGLEFMIKFHRIHCMGYRRGVAEGARGDYKKDKRHSIKQCFETASTLLRNHSGAVDIHNKVLTLYCEFLTALLHEECTYRGYPDYVTKPLEQGQKYVVHVPRQVIQKRGGVANERPFTIEGLFKNSTLPGEYFYA